jgi:hypothetical protein
MKSKNWIVVAFMLVLTVLSSSAFADECAGQGDAAMLIKGSCTLGTPLKFKLAGPPNGFFRLWRDLGAGPVEVPGVGTFCLDFSPERLVIASGHLNHLGFHSTWHTLPDDPRMLGQEIAFQFAAIDPVTNEIVISNGYNFGICDDEGGDCDQGIRRLGYFTIIRRPDEYPVTLTSRAYWSQHPEERVGEVTFLFDPDDPPAFPIVSGDGDMTVTKVETFPGVILVHAVARGCDFANGRLPNNTTFETVAGEVAVWADIHTSCSIPISAGSNFNPVFITFLQDVKNAPEGDCD